MLMYFPKCIKTENVEKINGPRSREPESAIKYSQITRTDNRAM